ncbi:MAG TPA: DUF5946 family protein [Anaerolineales bacterium]|nr:DUF5946 family protein [Anaerolineales bacterium]
MTICRECGGIDCEARFHECLALEFADPEYGVVHHLTVATYMLQHSARLSLEGWLFERQLLEDFILNGADPAQIRRAHRADVDNARRKFKFRSINGRPLFDNFAWPMTILDVRKEPPRAYREDITAWARKTLLASQDVLLEKHES